MSTRINIGCSPEEVPTEIPIPDPGVYDILIKNIETKPNKAQDGTNIVVECEIADCEDENFNGYALTSYIPMKGKNWRTNLKQFVLSCGGTFSEEIDLAELIGARAKGRLTHSDSDDPKRPYTNLRRFIVPEEAALEAASAL